jgi:hypothetical protein
MHGRRMQPEDLQRIAAIFREQGFDYELPAMGNNILAKRVVESGSTIVCGAAARLTVEVYGFFDRLWESPRWRLEALKLLHEQMCVELKEKGIEDMHAWLPPRIERAFGRRLVQFDWQRPLWTDFVRQI